ncbi:MAG: hypothetical protein ACE5JS_13475 [Nitrospinota bacterium]
MPKKQIDKAEAARRQIETAIRLLFANWDEVSTHTLAFASLNLTRDLCKKHNKSELFDEILIETVKPDKRKQVQAQLRKYYNYFRHADRDHTALIDLFEEPVNEFIVLFAMNNYKILGNELTPTMEAFFGWLILIHPKIFADHKLTTDQIAVRNVLCKLPRPDQLECGLAFIAQHLGNQSEASEIMRNILARNKAELGDLILKIR